MSLSPREVPGEEFRGEVLGQEFRGEVPGRSFREISPAHPAQGPGAVSHMIARLGPPWGLGGLAGLLWGALGVAWGRRERFGPPGPAWGRPGPRRARGRRVIYDCAWGACGAALGPLWGRLGPLEVAWGRLGPAGSPGFAWGRPGPRRARRGASHARGAALRPLWVA